MKGETDRKASKIITGDKAAWEAQGGSQAPRPLPIDAPSPATATWDDEEGPPVG